MASIEKRGNTWSVRYVVKDNWGNIIGQKRKSGFETKADAMAAARDLEQATARGVDVHGDQLTCGEIMERWFLSKVGNVEKTTLSRYSLNIDSLRKYPVYDTKVANLGRDAARNLIDEIMERRGVKLSSALILIQPFRFSLQWAASEGLILKNPIAGAKLPASGPPRQAILSEADITDMVRKCQEARPQFLPALYLALYGGLCREEVAGLTWACVTPSGVVIREARAITVHRQIITKQPKTAHRARTVTLPRFVMDLLAGMDHTTPLVMWCSSRRNPYGLGWYADNTRLLALAVNADRAKTGREPMPLPTYHDLRHTHAAMCISLGLQPKVISERLGHASIKITMDTYGYLMPGLQGQAADAINDAWAGKVGK